MIEEDFLERESNYMKLEIPENENYAAVIVEVKVINELTNCDNVVGLPFFGYQAIASKDVQVGDRGVLFTAETRLSDEFLSQNNLYRKAERNANPEETGYFEDNGRVRAMKFRKNLSNALFMPLESLVYTGVDINDFAVGDTFDQLNGHPICKKYVVKEHKPNTSQQQVKTKIERIDERVFPRHINTAQYLRNLDAIPEGAQVAITQKLHGTSVRIGNLPVKKRPSLWKRLLKAIGGDLSEFQYESVWGSRKVIKDPQNAAQGHWYGTDVWGEVAQRFHSQIPEGFIIYGEVIGWFGDQPIQPNFTYNLEKGTWELYVYRVAVQTPQNILVDLSWDQVKAFCRDNGFRHTPELCYWDHEQNGDPELFYKTFLDKSFTRENNNTLSTLFAPAYAETPVPLSDPKMVDEGVVVRWDGGLTPTLLKAKSPLFLEHETALNDRGEEDMESSQS